MSRINGYRTVSTNPKKSEDFTYLRSSRKNEFVKLVIELGFVMTGRIAADFFG
jgi:hypothetical protein